MAADARQVVLNRLAVAGGITPRVIGGRARQALAAHHGRLLVGKGDQLDAVPQAQIDGDALERWIANDHDYVVSALGTAGPDRLSRDWRRLGTTLKEHGRDFFNAALDQLIEISQAH